MSGSGRQKKGKQKLHSNKPGNKSGFLRVEPELGPKQCDSDTGPEFGGTQETISMHGNMRLFLGSTPFPTNPMYCSDEELENMLLNKLDSIYSQAIDKLMSLGYPCDVVWNAVLTSGYVFGDEDILTNIVQHSIDYIKTNESRRNGTDKDPPRVAESLKLAVKSSLAVMVFTLCQAQPNLKKSDAMSRLLMTNFDLGFVSTLMVLGKGSDGLCQVAISKGALSSEDGVQGDQEFADCQNTSFGNKTPAEEFEKRLGKSRISVTGFNLTPSEQERLKKNIAKFSVAFQTDMKASFEEIQAEKNLLSGKPSAEQFEWEDSCVDNLMLDGIGTLISNKEPTSESVDKKTKMILLLVHDIKEMKDQAKERKEWAKMKVVEAAKKLCHNLLELKALRMEKRKQKNESESGLREKEQRMMMRFMELENAMDRTTYQYDRSNKASNDIENGNAEIRAEIKAHKLRTSESDEKLAKVVTKEKKSVKKIVSGKTQ